MIMPSHLLPAFLSLPQHSLFTSHNNFSQSHQTQIALSLFDASAF